MSEYLKYRCCMCPNINKDSKTCPGIKETPHPEPDECRFVKMYIDSRGWKYKVMQGLGESNFKARYQKPGKTGWKCMANMEWRKSFDEAQSNLNAMAKIKCWDEIQDAF